MRLRLSFSNRSEPKTWISHCVSDVPVFDIDNPTGQGRKP